MLPPASTRDFWLLRVWVQAMVALVVFVEMFCKIKGIVIRL